MNARGRRSRKVRMAIKTASRTADKLNEKECNVTANAHQVRRMLGSYGKQLVTARRLARYYRSLAAAGAEDEVRIAQEAKRRALVDQVAREVVENLLVTGSDSSLVLDIRQRLERELGEILEFTYPPGELDMQIFRHTETGPEELQGDEKHRVLNQLWDVTLAMVNDTML